jgi:hypothetical protein
MFSFLERVYLLNNAGRLPYFGKKWRGNDLMAFEGAFFLCVKGNDLETLVVELKNNAATMLHRVAIVPRAIIVMIILWKWAFFIGAFWHAIRSATTCFNFGKHTGRINPGLESQKKN